MKRRKHLAKMLVKKAYDLNIHITFKEPLATSEASGFEHRMGFVS